MEYNSCRFLIFDLIYEKIKSNELHKNTSPDAVH